MPTLTDKGYHGAGIGILTPAKGHNLDPDTACRNALLTAVRAIGEPGNALLKPDGEPSPESASAPGESASSPPQHSSYPPLERGRY